MCSLTIHCAQLLHPDTAQCRSQPPQLVHHPHHCNTPWPPAGLFLDCCALNLKALHFLKVRKYEMMQHHPRRLLFFKFMRLLYIIICLQVALKVTISARFLTILCICYMVWLLVLQTVVSPECYNCFRLWYQRMAIPVWIWTSVYYQRNVRRKWVWNVATVVLQAYHSNSLQFIR